MRKEIITLCLSVLCCITSYGQSNQNLQLHFKLEKNDLQLNDELWLEAYIINTSTQEIKLFEIGHSEPGWNGYKEKWVGTVDNEPIQFSSFGDNPSSKFTIKNIISVQPGDSIYAGILRHKLDKAGKYKITYSLSQDPAKINYGWSANSAATSLAKTITKFSIISKPLYIEIQPVQLDKASDTPLPKGVLANQPMYTDLNKAFSSPSDVIKLTIQSNITNEELQKVSTLKNLKVLHIEDLNDTLSLPSEFSELHLQELKISNIPMIYIPEEFSKMNSLRVVAFSGIKINQLPNFIYNLNNLEVLIVNSCPINTISDDISKLRSLKKLDFNSVNLEEITPMLSELESIEEIKIYGKLKTFPNVFNCPNLKKLDLSFNKEIQSIPSDICKLQNLVEINLSSNKITSIPDEIGNMKKLEIFLIKGNKLKEIPVSLYNCTSLQKVDISCNQITIIPANINKLINLANFAAYQNKLETVPVGLSQCPKLSVAWMHTNNIQKNDKEGKILAKKLGKNYCYTLQH